MKASQCCWVLTILALISVLASAKACPCTREYRPLCGPDGTTYANKCIAKCAKVPASKLTNGPCSPDPLPITCDKGSPVAKCDGNPCDKPSPCKGHPDLQCIANSCGRATYYGTRLSGPTGICKGVYLPKKAPFKVITNCNKALPQIKCDRKSNISACLVDPCQSSTSPCKGDPRYVCVSNYCSHATYLGTRLVGGGCRAVYVDPITHKVVPQCLEIPILTCDPNTPVADCLPTSNPCAKTCNRNPALRCIVNSCTSATYQGVKLTKKSTCKAIYVDPGTQSVVKSCTKQF